MPKLWNELHPRDWPTLPAWLAVAAEKLYRNMQNGTLFVRCKDKQWLHVSAGFEVLQRIEARQGRKKPPFHLLS